MRSPTKKSFKRILLAICASVILSISSGIVYAGIDHIGYIGGGTVPAFISCGSSAGNYAFYCDDTGCHEDRDPEIQAWVDGYCASPDSCLNRGGQPFNIR
jgi:hypothetical protein